LELILLALILTLSVVAVIQLVRVSRKLKLSGSADVSALVREEFRASRSEAAEAARRLREEIATAQKISADGLAVAQKQGVEATSKAVKELGKQQQEALSAVELRVKRLADANEERLERLRKVLDTQIEGLQKSNHEALDKLRTTVDAQLKQLQETNEKKLEQMRTTVDEKLQSTLEKRLGESFKLVSERLEAVQRGLGDMQNLATGVGDLKRVLTNVKTRGTWGEYQIGDILEQILAPDQYEKNVQPKPNSAEIVEYAVKLPGRGDDSTVWLPIDAKFPLEDYQRLLDATEAADAERVERSTKELARTIQAAAKDISTKYLAPPYTTDFAILFLPTEGLYAEVLRQPGMIETLQQKHRVVVAGPTTLSAILNSLRMGFRTLAIEKRSSEVWEVLAAVKTEFGKFGDVLVKVKKQLATASNTIDSTEIRTRAMERKLRSVEELPQEDASKVLEFDAESILDGGSGMSKEERGDD